MQDRQLLDGKYVLGDVIGAGGMGVVHRALQPALGRMVAVKLLRRELVGDPRMIRHFRREALAAARVAHRGLVAVHDLGETPDGRPYLVLELILGRLLSALHVEGELDLRRIVDLGRQVLDVLAAVHGAGIVHADIKTDNLIVETLDHGDRVRVIDFGLAVIAPAEGQSADDPLFQDDRVTDAEGRCYVSGTPSYMAPEVLGGGLPVAASDLYGVGIVLYELLTGRTPFASESVVATILGHLRDPVVPPSVRRPDRGIPRALEDAIARALAKAPADRFPDAATFAAALADAMPPEAAPTDLAETTASWRAPRALTAETARGLHGPRIDDAEPRLRCEIADAIVAGDVERLAAGYLALAVMLDARGDRGAAVRELIEGIDIASAGGDRARLVAGTPAARLRRALAILRGHQRRRSTTRATPR